MPRILISGRNRSGSFRIRGEQLGQAMGFDSEVRSNRTDYTIYGLVVMVKRITDEQHRQLQKYARKWVWDIVDAWPQPLGNYWGVEESMNWLRQELKRLQPDAVVFPTIKMQQDAQWDGPSIALPHHAWPKYSPILPRKEIRHVAYEGGDYLGHWETVLRKECKRRGWTFSNDSLEGADIGIALRSVNGYAPVNWKSNVKLANIQALGIPALCSPEYGYKECGSGAELFVTEAHDITSHFDWLEDVDRRREIGRQMLGARIDIEDVAGRYKKWLLSLL